jgi:hypothetical protein
MSDQIQIEIEAAIAAEAIDWALFFKVTDAAQIEGRRQVMRANVAVGYFEPLMKYLQAGKLRAFLATITDLDDFLYANSVCDIANAAEVTPDDVHAWLKAYREAP